MLIACESFLIPELLLYFAAETYKDLSQTGVKNQEVRSASAVPEVDQSSQAVRFIKFVIDDITANSPQDILLACGAIEKYVAASTQPTDQLSFVTSSGTYELPFTNDRRALVDEATELHKKFMIRGRSCIDCPKLSDYQAQAIMNNSDPEAWDVPSVRIE